MKGGRLDAGKEVGWGRGAVISVCHGGDGDGWVGALPASGLARGLFYLPPSRHVGREQLATACPPQ